MVRIMDTSEASTFWRDGTGVTQLLPAPRIVEAKEYFIDFDILRRGLTIAVPPFAGSRPGLTVQAGLISTVFRYDTTAVVGDPSQELRVPVPPDAALSFEGRMFQAGYGYVDGGDSGSSALRPYHARLDIEFPLVDEAVDDTIPAAIVSSGITLRIRPYSSMREGDRIIVHVVGSHPRGSAVAHLSIEASDVGNDVLHPVDGTIVQANQGGELSLIYEVHRGAVARLSMPLTLKVESAMGAVVPAYGVPGEHLLPLLPLTYDDHGCVPVTVDLPLSATDGDRATLLCLGGGLNRSALVRKTVTGSTTSLSFCLPHATVLANLDLIVRLGCVLERSNGVVDSTVTTFRVVENKAS